MSEKEERQESALREEREALRLCLQKVEDRFAMSSHHAWTESSYRTLSEQITEASKRTVSINTLRRLYSKVSESGEPYMPKTETKNALAIYLGYKDWYEFRRSLGKKEAEESTESGTNPSPNTPYSPSTNTPSAPILPLMRRPWAVALVALGLVSVLTLIWLTRSSPADTERWAKIVPDSGLQTVPCYIGYRIEAQGYPLDSLRVVFQDGETLDYEDARREQFSKRIVRGGLFGAKLYYGSDPHFVHDTHFVALTRGLQRLVQLPDKHFAYPFDAPSLQAVTGLSPTEVNQLIAKHKHAFHTKVVDYRRYLFSADDIVLKTRIKNRVLLNDLDCYSTKIKLFCRGHNQVFLCFPQLHCPKMNWMRISEVNLEGRKADLSAMCTDFSDWKDVEVRIAQGRCQVKVEGKLVFEQAYTQPLGQLNGVELVMEGDGDCQYLTLEDSKGHIYQGQR